MPRLLSLLILILALSACGQKGPLYLPEAPNEQPVPAPPPETVIDESPETDNDEPDDEQ